MKLKRIMSMVLCFAMVLSTMSFNVFAQEATTVSDAEALAAALTSDQESIEITLANDIEVPMSSLGTQTSGSGEYKLGSENTNSIVIDLNNHKMTITTSYMSAIGAKNEDATITIKNGTMNSTGNSAATWNINDLMFANCNYEFEDVIFDKEVALTNTGKNVTMKDVTINGTGDYYALWIQAEGQNVTIDGLTINAPQGRGIKIDEQYSNENVAKVTLDVSNATFTTAKKAAIVVKSVEGAEITTTNVDISAVAADSKNIVWVDEDSADYQDKVTVNNDPAFVEGTVATVDGEDFTDLQEALNAAAAGEGNVTVEILENIDLTAVDWDPVLVSAPKYPVVTVNGNDKIITGLNDMLFAGTWAGGSGLIINDLTIADSAIVNDKDDANGNVGVGAFIGFPQASATVTLNNCHLVNSSVEGGHWTGGLIGYAAGYAGNDGPVFMNLTINNCSVIDSTVTGKGSTGGIIGHATGNAWTKVTITDTTVSGNTVTSTGSSANKAGAVIGTIGAAGQATTVNGVEKTGGVSVAATVSGNNVTSSSATITTIYGRQGTGTGMLYVTGGEYDEYPIEENVAYAAPIKGYEIADNGDGTWGVAEKIILSGSGTEADPYLINNLDDLVAFRNDVNAGNTYEGKYVKLTADIDLEGYEEMNVNYKGNNVSESTFRPIGDYSCNKASFKGIFDGGNNTISNLYISGWDINYHWDNYGPAGLFGTVENATIKNLTVEGFEIQVEGGDVAAIAGHAKGNCTFENITVTDSKIATYNNGCAGIVAWSEAGNYTFKGIEVTDSVVLAGLWGSFDSSIGGVLAQADAGATYLFEDIDVACRLDIYNDVTAAYKYHLYRMCGMLIGRGAKFMDANEVDLNASNITCKNVNITIGEWANYTYINTSGNTWKRVEPGYTYDGVDVSQYPDATIDQKPMTSIVGGGQYGYSGTTAEEFAAQGFDETEIKVVDFAKIARSNVAKIGDNYFASIQSAIDAAENGDTVTLLSNVDIANETINTLGGKYNTYYKVTGKSITIDLNGKTISGEYNNDSMLVGVFSTEQNGHLTLTGNGKINITATKTVYSLLVNYDSTSTLTVEDGEYTVDKVSSSLVYSDKGSVEGLYGNTISGVTINGGTFTLGNIDNVNGPWIFNVGGSGDSYVSVNGGTFNFNIAHQKWAEEVVVSKNCYVSDNGDGTWTVKDGAQVTLNDTVLSGPYALRMDFGYPTFADAAAVAETDDVITLISDATGEASFDDIRNLTVDLNGYTLNGAILPSEGDITVKNGSIVNENSGVSAIELNEGKLSLKNVNISSARHGVRIDGAVETVIDGGKYTLTATSGTRHAVNVSGAANVTIKNGTFVGPKGTTMDSGSAVCVQTGANVTIEGGNFSGGKNATLGVSGTMSITGGTFDQDPYQYVAVGYAAKANDAGIYSIVSIKPDAYTVEARASKTEVRYNNDNTADSFTVEYVATGGSVIGAMAQYNYDNTLFTCAEDDDKDGVLILYNNDLTTDTNGETIIAKLNFTVKGNVDQDTPYTFIAEKVQITSDFGAAGSGAQNGFVENVIGDEVTVVAQWKVTLPTDDSLLGNTYVDKNTNYSATINNFDENMTYTIKYTMGDGEDQTITVTKDNVENDGFVIENVTGDIVFKSVEAKLNCEIVLVSDFVTGRTLVLVKDGVANGYTYDNAPMYPVARYENIKELSATANKDIVGDILNATSVRAILIDGRVTEAEARAAIKAADSEPEDIEKSFDVNGDKQLYFNDAMTAHGCLKKQYDITLAKELAYYLRADVDTDFRVRSLDYDETVGAVLGKWYGEN